MPLHHIALRSIDPSRVARFYREVLGLAPLRVTESGSHWLALGGNAVLMVERRPEGEPGVPVGSMEFIALSVLPDELGVVESRCARWGVAIEHRTAFTRYFRDPDGRRVGVSCYRFETNPID